MPTVFVDRLRLIASALLVEAGASREEAAIVSEHCVDANLAGHDSHGVIQIPFYIDQINRGQIIPGARLEIVRESPTTTVVDGHGGFGQVVSTEAMRMTVGKAKQLKVAATTVRHQSHVGRLADYPIMAANEGLIGLMTADSGGSEKSVAPFGGREPRLGSNPICIAVPSRLKGPMFVDIATSTVAVGKLDIARSRGEQVPQGWILDHDGNPTTDPSTAGVVLPMGGDQGHKGYGLSVMVEILSGILTGLGFGHDPEGPHSDGCFMAAFDVEAFFPLEEFKTNVTDFAKYLTDTAPTDSGTKVLYPGEPEYISAHQRQKEGIFIEGPTWRRLEELATDYGIEEILDTK